MKARVIALYLPQFHRVKENDEIWGTGFTEWINVAKARPQFPGHYQPQLPSELGFYDLSISEHREKQARLAKQYGVEGFCYWYYWFGNGKQILEKPFNDVVSLGKPDFPFCVAWANHSWSTRTWTNVKGTKNTTFLEQKYLGVEDYKQFFYTLLPAFKDSRYIKVDNCLLFTIFDPSAIPIDELTLFVETWQKLAALNGIEKFHFVARVESMGPIQDFSFTEQSIYTDCTRRIELYKNVGIDAVWLNNMRLAEYRVKGKIDFILKHAIHNKLNIGVLDRYNYQDIVNKLYLGIEKEQSVYPMIIPRWDKTPRQGKKAPIYSNSNPRLFQDHVKKTITLVSEKPADKRIVYLQAWNEWGEGNYMEPDIVFQRAYLEALKSEL